MNRKRYTVTAADGSQAVVLAYSAHGAREYYSQRGLTIVRVERGDYRKKARNATIKASGGFRIDRVALADAIEFLGLTLPVDIRFHSRVGNTNGIHRFRKNRHVIMLKSYLKPKDASNTLWHELTHARQAERALSRGERWQDVTAEQRNYPYSVRPIEREANEIANSKWNVLLCKPS